MAAAATVVSESGYLSCSKPLSSFTSQAVISANNVLVGGWLNGGNWCTNASSGAHCSQGAPWVPACRSRDRGACSFSSSFVGSALESSTRFSAEFGVVAGEPKWVYVRCESGAASVAQRVDRGQREVYNKQLTTVMKFGGSSVATSERMQEVADLISSFPEERPVIVLSAMGQTTNYLLLAGEKAITCGAARSCQIEELAIIKELHLRTADELGVSNTVISELLEEMEQLLTGIALMKELTVRTKDYLVSFGERLSTRIFAAYMNIRGIKTRQYDAFDIGIITTDEFSNAEILETTYVAVAEKLLGDWEKDPAIPVVTGFLGKGQKTGATTTLGRGGSDLTATAIGRALNLREIQVWKDVDGVLTCDPKIHSRAFPVPFLTFDEAAELAYFGAQVLHPQSMRPAREGNIPVRVKNSYNRQAPGTLITKTRDLRKALLTSIVLKQNVTMLDIVSTRMLGQYGFLAKVFSTFEKLGISVDVVATSEVSISLTLDPSKLWSRELIQQELDRMVEELEKIAVVRLVERRSIISLIGNVERSSLILKKVFSALHNSGINVQMISQGASKVNISLVVDNDQAERCVKALHLVFFEQDLSEELGTGVLTKAHASSE